MVARPSKVQAESAIRRAIDLTTYSAIFPIPLYTSFEQYGILALIGASTQSQFLQCRVDAKSWDDNGAMTEVMIVVLNLTVPVTI